MEISVPAPISTIVRRNINLDKYLSQSIAKDTRADVDEKIRA